MTITSELSRDANDRVWLYALETAKGVMDGASGAEPGEASPAAEESYEFAGFHLYPQRRKLLLDGEAIPLGARAFDLLNLLVAKAGVVVSSGDLMRAVWYNITVEDANLRVQMAMLRRALSQCDGAQRAIETIPLRGYCFVLPVRHHRNAVEPDTGRAAAPIGPPNLLCPVVGREETIRQLLVALDERRLVTITGPGGIGKTTAAIATASRYAATHTGEVAFADLSQAADGAAAAELLAETLRLPPGGDTLAALHDHLCAREVLLILDTCEHLVEPMACLAEWLLAACDNLKLLVTSREALRATGEWTHRLASLTFPAEGEAMSTDEIDKFSAVAMFVERAQSSRLGEPFDRDLPYIAEICRRLDGIPLALEFAAARVADLGPARIAARLDDRFAILTRGRRTALPRHRTLSAALDWSYGLLSSDEQRMLARLARLCGPFDAEQALAEGERAGCQRPNDAFLGLYEKSLISVDIRDDEPSYGLLDTTRAYVNGLPTGAAAQTSAGV